MDTADKPKDNQTTISKRQPVSPVARSKHTGYPTSGGETRKLGYGLQSDDERISSLCGRIELLRAMMKENHIAIDNCAHLLNKSQPPRSGKIEIRWWKRGGYTLPTIIKWGVDGKPVALSLSSGITRCANSTGNFEKNYEDTVKILAILADLMKSRNMLIKYIGDFSRLITRYEKFSHKSLVEANNFGIFELIESRIDKRAIESK